MPLQVQTLQDTANPQDIALLKNWATFTKALAVYPESNVRVARGMQAFIEGLEKRFETQENLTFIVYSDLAVLPSGVFDISQEMSITWLKTTLNSGQLSGVRFYRGIEKDSVHAFTKHLLQHISKKPCAQGHDERWSESYTGLQPLERVFEDSYLGLGFSPETLTVSSRPQTAQELLLVELLESKTEISKKLDDLRQKLTDGNSDESINEEHKDVDIIGRIVHLLPADSINDSERVAELTSAILDRVTQMDNTAIQSESLSEENSLNRLMIRMCYKFFPRVSTTSNATAIRLDVAEAHQKRYELDEAIVENLQGLLGQIKELPDSQGYYLSDDEVFHPQELLGIYLYILVRPEKEQLTEQLHPRICEILETAGEDVHAVLRCYLSLMGQAKEDGGELLHYERVLSLLRKHEFMQLLRTCDFLSVTDVAEQFPDQFFLYLDSLNLQEEEDQAQFTQLVDRLGPDRIIAARDALLKTGSFGDHMRAERLLASSSVASLPFVHLIIHELGDSTKTAVIEYLRRVNLEDKEMALIPAHNNPDEISMCYLSMLSARKTDGSFPKDLKYEIAKLLCRIIRRTGASAKDMHRRVYAIALLSKFQTHQAKALLTQLTKFKNVMTLSREPKPVRNAAKAALKRYK